MKTRKLARDLCKDRRTKAFKTARDILIQRSWRDPAARRALEEAGICGAHLELKLGELQNARQKAGVKERPKGTLHLKQRLEHETVSAQKIAEMRETRSKATAKNWNAPRHR